LVNSNVIMVRLNKHAEYLHLLERLRSHPKKEFLTDPFVYGNVERYLQLAIQIIIDIGNHILSERNVTGIVNYQDIIVRLGTEGIIPIELAVKIEPMAGLRNILVHEYIEIDREKLYDFLQYSLKDFKEFVRHVKEIL